MHEVRDAQNGLMEVIGKIERRLGHPGTSAADRVLLEQDLSRASKMLDVSEMFVPRIK